MNAADYRHQADEWRDMAADYLQRGDKYEAQMAEFHAKVRDDAAHLLDLDPTAAVDLAALAAARNDRLARVYGAELLDDVRAFLSLYVAFPDAHTLAAATLWTAHTHLLDSFESTPRLAVLSPEPGSGKTRTLEVAELLVPDSMLVLSASAASIFRSIEKARPTLLFDEVDALFRGRGRDESAEDLRALLNAGHRRGATIPRCTGPTHDVRRFPVFAACALAGLGDLPDTLMSRSIIIRMRKRAPGEHVRPFRIREAEPKGLELADRLATWAEGVAEDLCHAWPTMPPGVTDRPADVWEPLLGVADAAGGHWPETARAACVELCKVSASREASLGVRLLEDLRTIFDKEEVLATETILDRLHKLDESPWADLRGKPLDARGLAYRLGKYGVSPTKVTVDNRSVRGYRVHATDEHPGPDLFDAWERYLDPLPPEEAESTERAESPRSEAPSEVPFTIEVPEPAAEAEPDAPPLTCEVPDVPPIPHMREEVPPATAEADEPEDLGAWTSDTFDLVEEP